MDAMDVPICCNSCYTIKYEEDSTSGLIRFFFTNCKHVMCEPCLRKVPNHCGLCNKICKVMEINDRMPDGIRDLFRLESVNEHKDKMKKIMIFQHEQYEIAANNCNMLKLVEEDRKLEKKCEDVLAESNAMSRALKKEKALCQEMNEALRSGNIDKRIVAMAQKCLDHPDDLVAHLFEKPSGSASSQKQKRSSEKKDSQGRSSQTSRRKN